MYCKNCGSQLKEGQAFCTACGCSINAPTPTLKAQDNKNGESTLWLAVSICNLALAGITFLIGLISVIVMSVDGFSIGTVYLTNRSELSHGLLTAVIISVGATLFSGVVAALCIRQGGKKIINLVTLALAALFFFVTLLTAFIVALAQ